MIRLIHHCLESLTDVAPFNHSAQIAHTESFRAAR